MLNSILFSHFLELKTFIFSGGGLSGDQWTVVVGATTAAIVFIGLMVLLCCCCLCKKKKMMEKKNAKGNFIGSMSCNVVY
jgi:hypothetical protein